MCFWLVVFKNGIPLLDKPTLTKAPTEHDSESLFFRDVKDANIVCNQRKYEHTCVENIQDLSLAIEASIMTADNNQQSS